MLETERVGDPLATCVGHEDSNATVVIQHVISTMPWMHDCPTCFFDSVSCA